MKVLQISANWGHGGPGSVEKDIYCTLAEAGHKCVIAYGRGSVPPEIESYRIGKKIDNYIHYAAATLFDKAGFSSTNPTKKLIAYIQSIKPDVIQLHNLLGYYINIDVLFSFLKNCGIPVVWTVHDCWPITGHCINFERVGCEKWKTGCGSCKLTHDYPRALVDRSGNNLRKKKELLSGLRNLTIVAPSRWLENLLKQSYLSQYDIKVINNGIDLSLFKPTDSDYREKYGLGEKKILLFVASVWNEMKGLNLIQELSQIVSPDFKIVIIGKNSEFVSGENVLTFGRTSDVSELVKWYSAADVFVNPTLGDNFPTVNIEALACGVPVVTNATGGSPEIPGEECGGICYSKTAGELYQRINEIISKKIDKTKCTQRAGIFERSKCYRQYIDLYERLLISK